LGDVQGRRWSFLDKAAIFGSDIFRTSRFPLPGVIQCEIVSSSRDDAQADTHAQGNRHNGKLEYRTGLATRVAHV
jgi:hypothetical protein